jgi:uncharacterized protein YfaT (DUF1175 family)
MERHGAITQMDGHMKWVDMAQLLRWTDKWRDMVQLLRWTDT